MDGLMGYWAVIFLGKFDILSGHNKAILVVVNTLAVRSMKQIQELIISDDYRFAA
ncbi:hypothetical protein KS4_26940 [Poriferisphaera corsica]|uniref:Uncharacterized protein n=1 Tax=Poriferisphaera corsica TaxID=2528020 RepID=A0A517YWM4_9BACT|nr:hypothetical protein KS4_26940 [Poriferisphaera corsica]